jgi:hypothetical protein
VQQGLDLIDRAIEKLSSGYEIEEDEPANLAIV